MSQQHLVVRTALIGACGAGVLFATHAWAGGKSKAPNPCVVAYQAGQERQQSGHLRDARESFAICAKAACGRASPKCAAAATQLDAQIASIIPMVSDAAGPIDVQVKVDGEVWATRLDGRALPIDPGIHEFSFTTDRGVAVTQKVMIFQGQRGPLSFSVKGAEKGRVAVSTPAAATVESKAVAETQAVTPTQATGAEAPAGKETAPPADAAARLRPTESRPWALPTSPLPYVVGGAGLAALGTGALFSFWGNKDNDLAVAQCRGGCSQSTVDHIKTMYVAADISFGVGIAALGVTTWLFASSRSDEKEPASAATMLDVQPVRSGAVASVRGSF